jgi:hypothetical protein
MYAERLGVPWWSWPVAIGFAAIASAEVFLGADPQVNWIPYAIFIPLVIFGLIRLGSVVIRVDPSGDTEREFRVDDAHIPLSYVTEVNILDHASKIELLGPAAAPHVFVIQRPWVRGAVRIVIDDPADPTPYWVISTRRPTALVAAINKARAATL